MTQQDILPLLSTGNYDTSILFPNCLDITAATLGACQ